METLTPREIVQELDKYIIGQDNAKRMVAISIEKQMAKETSPGRTQG